MNRLVLLAVPLLCGVAACEFATRDDGGSTPSDEKSLVIRRGPEGKWGIAPAEFAATPGSPAAAATPEAEPRDDLGPEKEAPAPPTAPAPPVVAAPSRVAAKSLQPGAITVEWSPGDKSAPPVAYELFKDGKLIATTPTPTVRDEGVTPSVVHCYQVRAVTADGTRSALSRQICTSAPDVEPPSVPAGVLATAVASSEIKLAWDASSDDVGVRGYDVLRSGSPASRVDFPVARATDLKPAVEYCFTVVAFDAAGNRSAPSAATCATTPDTSPPSEPGRILASAPTETRVVLRWAPSKDDVGVEKYEVHRGETLVATSAGPESDETGLAPLREYCYSVTALDRAGNRSTASGPACVTTPDQTPPTVPADVVATALDNGEVRLDWKPSTDLGKIARYEVVLKGAVTKTSSSTSVTLGDLRAAVEHCFQVRAVDDSRNVSGLGGPACAIPLDVVPPSAPVNLVVATSAPKHMVLTWDGSEDNVAVAGYEVLREGRAVEKRERCLHHDGGLVPLTKYCYTVRAYDAAGNRSPSTKLGCATTADPSLPSAPLEVRTDSITPHTIALRWESTGESGVVYRIYKDGQKSGVTAGLTFVESSLEPETRHCFNVVALNRAGLESPKLPPVCATTAAKSLAAATPAAQ